MLNVPCTVHMEVCTVYIYFMCVCVCTVYIIFDGEKGVIRTNRFFYVLLEA
jgi:hypothetical protein